MSPNRVVLALLLTGLILLPGPAYAIGIERLDGPDRDRSSAGYVATPIDASNDSLLADRYGGHLSFRTGDLTHPYVAADYRAPNETRRVLERAIRNGTATTSSQAVYADLQQLQRNETFVTISHDAYYDYSISTAADTTTVRTTPVDNATIARAVRDELVVAYGQLPPAQQATFDKIRNATEAPDQYEYRPWSDEPVPDEPLVERDGTHYAVEVVSHTDDLNFPDGLFLGIIASAVGLVSLLASGGVWLYGRWRD
ncbi:hypothetical protein [Halosolutus halophilus]|uniref:hypothetical protein n=1 Tax=Halosolutus halophilus TaxID=1552990 RepID=UPI0022351B86|nr:hypothetical protein [Halosolutus halophilus]